MADHLLRHQHPGTRLDSAGARGPTPATRTCEDRIRNLKDTGLRNLPFHDYAKNRLWLEVVALAADLLAWTQTLAFHPTEPARRW